MKKTSEDSTKIRGRGWKKSIRCLLLIVLAAILVKGAVALGFLSFIKDRHSAWLSTTEVLAEDRKGSKEARSTAPGGDLPKQESERLIVASGGAAPHSARSGHLDIRESELMRRQRELEQKEETLKKMEQDVQKKFEELNAIQKEIQDYQAERASQKNARIRSLVKIYESMKPKEAAKLLENLEEQLVVNIISTMNTEAAASILAVMDTKKAAKISQVLSTP